MSVDITNEINLIPCNRTRIAMQKIMDAVLVDLTAIKTKFDAHTHNADGSETGAYYTSPPRSNAADVTAGTASSITLTLAD